LTAFEELATNAILHKEYDTPEYVGIYIYRDRISFVNHNRPLPPVTIEALNNNRIFDKRQYLNKELKDMFFSLNLIESYGSGIRRAKDYTNAVMKINKEFFNSSKVGNTTQETTQENNNVINKILTLMIENPRITAKQISNKIENITFDGIRYHISNLKKSGKIRRKGSTKSGKWIVNGRKNE